LASVDPDQFEASSAVLSIFNQEINNNSTSGLTVYFCNSTCYWSWKILKTINTIIFLYYFLNWNIMILAMLPQYLVHTYGHAKYFDRWKSVVLMCYWSTINLNRVQHRFSNWTEWKISCSHLYIVVKKRSVHFDNGMSLPCSYL